ncbi:hypothetical protein FA09DRAFT_327159 [Tilletiopsis washingtonensis]|uniref:AAA+ ATPase domain-containing protein n=1 Tax=Tilletiopsis washingtonensis TaxID=58919 RepID=A0A316ZI66_9BASI|nr:hypothetical protein FA09DRAFT_327159 [Tilletiopsis washingtonensis]PWO01200.1 hypothetical protein FA09DRAFT_327159 [Tilletiopsis washingtonensis]
MRAYGRGADLTSLGRGYMLTPCSQRLLALSGPPGSGKTAVIRALASELDYEILEWQNSVNPHGRVGDGLGSGPASLTRRFEEFLAQAGRFPTLSLSSRQGGADAGHAAASQGQSQAGPSRRRLILLEDLPNLTHQTTRESFIAALELFLARALPSDGFPTPLVLIMSDSVVRQDADVGRMGDSSRSESVRTAMSLRIRSNPAYAEIA